MQVSVVSEKIIHVLIICASCAEHCASDCVNYEPSSTSRYRCVAVLCKLFQVSGNVYLLVLLNFLHI